jgi:hypothetical protein
MSSSDLPKLWTEPTKIGYIVNRVHYKSQSFQKIPLIKVGLLIKYFSKKNFLERFDQFKTLKNDFETQNFEIFDKVIHSFGKSDDVII